MTQDVLTDTIATITPAGWYADPTDASALRWWSGAGWTEHTAMATAPDAQQPAVAAPSLPAPTTTTPHTPHTAIGQNDQAAAPVSRRQLRELAQRSESGRPAEAPALFVPQSASPVDASRSSSTATSAVPTAQTQTDTVPTMRASRAAGPAGVDFRDESGYVDVSVGRAPVSVFTPLWPTRVHTLAVWLLALLPLLLAVTEKASTTLLIETPVTTVRLAAVASFLLLSGILALLDRYMLRAGGHSDTASPWWTLLTPLAYLIARSVRVRQETSVRSTGPVLVWLVTLLPATALVVGIARLEAMIPAY